MSSVIDQTRLSPNDLDGMAPLNKGWLWSILVGLLLPLTPSYTAVFLIIVAPYSRILHHTHRAYGRSNVIPIEAFVSLVLVPLAGMIATFGCGLGFYLLTSEHNSTTIAIGLYIVALTLAVIVEFLTLGFYFLIGHKVGRDILPFEPGIDPVRGIEKLQALRRTRAPSFLPGLYLCAARLADGAPPLECEADASIKIGTAWKKLREHPANRRQLRLIWCFGAAWILGLDAILLINRGFTYRLAPFSLYLLCACLLVRASAAYQMVLKYYVQLRWRRRIEYLTSEMGKASEKALDELDERMRQLSGVIGTLTNDLRSLQARLENEKTPQPPFRRFIESMRRPGRQRF